MWLALLAPVASIFRLVKWLDRKNWTPEHQALLARALNQEAPGIEIFGIAADGQERELHSPSSDAVVGLSRFRIEAETATGRFPAGWRLAVIPARDASEALSLYAGETPFELLGEDRILLRGHEIVVARIEPLPPIVTE